MYYRFKNVNDAYFVLRRDFDIDEWLPSRGGDVYETHTPIVFSFTKPQERVLFDSVRDANPFFHLFEALWMLAGGNNTKMLDYYVRDFGKRFANADGVMPGAYGYRWRFAFGFNQLEKIQQLLDADPMTRRAILGMWCPRPDLEESLDSPDVPCNMTIQFSRRRMDNTLDMYVFNRSNDLIWGALGANAVHMTILQEYMAEQLELKIGEYHVLTSNLHMYRDTHAKHPRPMQVRDHYSKTPFMMGLSPRPLNSTQKHWHDDLYYFVNEGYSSPPIQYRTSFFHGVVLPASWAWIAHKDRDYPSALRNVQLVQAEDWRYAMYMWMNLRSIMNAGTKGEVDEDEPCSA